MRSNPQETADLVTFSEEILNGKLHFLCSVSKSSVSREFILSDQGFDAMRKSSWSLHIAFGKSWTLFLILNFNKNLFLYYFSQSWSLLWFLMIVSNIKFCLLKYYWQKIRHNFWKFQISRFWSNLIL